MRLTVADAIFANLPLDRYTVIARHAFLNPTEARQDVVLSENGMLGVNYFYAEDDKLIRIEVLERRLDA